MNWNTRTAETEKAKFIIEHGGGDFGVAELARRLGISRKTAYKLLGR
jgi:hypothetical protein